MGPSLLLARTRSQNRCPQAVCFTGCDLELQHTAQASGLMKLSSSGGSSGSTCSTGVTDGGAVAGANMVDDAPIVGGAGAGPPPREAGALQEAASPQRRRQVRRADGSCGLWVGHKFP
jgi:hypothetical protein